MTLKSHHRVGNIYTKVEVSGNLYIQFTATAGSYIYILLSQVRVQTVLGKNAKANL